MKTNELKFWDDCAAVVRFGGKVGDINSLPEVPVKNLLQEVHNACLEEITQHDLRTLLNKFPLLIVDSSTRNAAAITHHGVFATLITTGLIEALSVNIRHFVCCSDSLAHNFDRSPRLDSSLWQLDLNNFLESVTPREARYFINCFGRALQFVCLHEVSHFVRDHAKYLDAAVANFCLEEVHWFSEDIDESAYEVRQKCEIDADIYALRLCQGIAVNGESLRPSDDGLDEFWLGELAIQIAGLLNLFLVLEDQSNRGHLDYRAHYPPLLHRAIIASSTVRHYYAKRGGLSDDFSIGLEAQIWIDLEKTVHELDIPTNTWVTPEKNKLNLDEMNKRLSSFHVFQDDLDKHLSQRISISTRV